MGTEGFSHAAWQPGQKRGSVPFHFGPAVKLSGTEADEVGAWKFKGSTVVIDWIMGTRRRTPGPKDGVREKGSSPNQRRAADDIRQTKSINWLHEALRMEP